MTSEWKDHVATRAQEIREMTDRREKVIEEFCENYTREIDRAQSRLNDMFSQDVEIDLRKSRAYATRWAEKFPRDIERVLEYRKNMADLATGVDIGEAQPNMTFGESGRGKSGILKPLAEEHTLPYFDCTMVEDVEIDLKKYWKATQRK